MVWVVIGVMALIAAIGTLIYYLDDVSAWLWSLWDRFMMFSGLGELLSPVKRPVITNRRGDNAASAADVTPTTRARTPATNKNAPTPNVTFKIVFTSSLLPSTHFLSLESMGHSPHYHPSYW
jgi:hypothetical protein